MLFNYVAKNEKGKTVVGSVDSVNLNSAASLLKERGLFIITLVPESKGTVGNLLKKLSKVSLNDKVNFTHQIAAMVSSGLTLSQSLGLFLGSLKQGPFQEVISGVLKDVEGGMPMSKSLERFPNIFPTTYISLIRSGEASGNLDTVLTRLAETLEKQRDFKAKVKSAMVYPVIVSVAMLGVFILVMVFVVPKLTAMYSNLTIELPLPTKIMIAISAFFSTRWYVLAGAIFGTHFGLKYYKNTSFGAVHLAKISLALPVFGKINKEKELTEFTRTLSLLLSAGVPIVDSLYISADATSNILYVRAIRGFAQKVEKGLPLSDLVYADPIFPPIVSQMVNVGQETGKMDEVLLKLSTYFEGEVDMKLKNLSAALEPIIILVLGVMVALLILSVITPIYKLTTSF